MKKALKFLSLAAAALVAGGVVPKPLTPRLAGDAGELAALAIALLVCVFLFRGGRGRAR